MQKTALLEDVHCQGTISRRYNNAAPFVRNTAIERSHSVLGLYITGILGRGLDSENCNP